MAKHHFGITPCAPLPHVRYDDFTPAKYGCIAVEDDALDPVVEDLCGLPCFWHTPDRPEHGLAYCGITLIPPESLDGFLRVIENRPGLAELAELLNRARQRRCFVIHYGL